MTGKRVLTGAVGVFVILLCAGTGIASTFGNLVLVVTDPDGATVPEARIVVTSTALQGARTATTGSNGGVLVAALPPGTYEVRVARAGFREEVVETTVVQNATRRLRISLSLAPAHGSVDVVAATPLVDPTRTGVSSHITVEEVDRLPVGRDYRAYPQLAPSVSVSPNSGGLETRYEPASKAGNNYHDRGAGQGSRDNIYYLDGFDITNFATSTGTLVFPNTAVQDEEITTSGLSPEYTGGAGYVASIVTRSGGPEFEGSVSLFLQQPWMRGGQRTSDARLRTAADDRWDAGLTLGGPVVRDRLWFFVAAQRRNTAEDVELSESASPEPTTSTYKLTNDNGFMKLSWQPSDVQRVTASELIGRLESSGTNNPNIPPNRFSSQEDDSIMSLLSAQRVFEDNFVIGARLGRFERIKKSVPEYPEEGPRNTLLFEPGVDVPAWMRLLGSAGDGGRTTHRKLQAGVTGSMFLEAHGTHEIRAGLQYSRWEEENATEAVFGETLTSLAPDLAGLSFADAVSMGLLPQSEYDWIYDTLAGDTGSDAFAAADTNGDGVLTESEFAALRFGSSAGNQQGVNFLRESLAQDGVNNVQQVTRAAFLEDRWVMDRWTLWGGMRLEDQRYVASDDSTILHMDPALYPRAGVGWDPVGNGSQRLSLVWGRYPDVLRSPMIRFAGNLSGAVREEQVFIGDDWYTYRTRGSAVLNRDAGFAPNLKNEEEEEIQLTWEMQLGANTRLLAEGYHRRDRHLIEDYNPGLYLDPAAAGDLALTPGDFGYPPEGPTDVNYFLANLVGGKREAWGVDLTLERRWADNWSASLQYSWKDAKGNSNSNGAADLQGDFLDLDPRQPWMWGTLPGTVHHQVKLYGGWTTPWKLHMGGLLYWNSGAVFTEADIFRPGSYDIYYNHQRDDGAYVRTGTEKNPSYWTVDLRLRYPFNLRGFGELTLWADVLNVLDNQDPLRIEEAHNNPEFTVCREPRLLLEPRRLQLGATLSW